MKGRRIYAKPDTDWLFTMQPGEYGCNETGQSWYVVTPNGMLGNISKHIIIDHDDGTITVMPSIKVTGGTAEESWHGYLEKGVWREV